MDASALIAINAGEPDAAELADLLEADRLRLFSAISVWETVAGLCRSYTYSIPAARIDVRRFLEAGNMQFVSIGEREFEIAAEDLASCSTINQPILARDQALPRQQARPFRIGFHPVPRCGDCNRRHPRLVRVVALSSIQVRNRL